MMILLMIRKAERIDMVGIDITHISRFENHLDLCLKILSSEEILEFNNSHKQAQYLASHFALKEAFLKANKLGLGGIDLTKISIKHHRSGAPYIEVGGERFEDCSLSHDGDVVIAIVNI